MKANNLSPSDIPNYDTDPCVDANRNITPAFRDCYKWIAGQMGEFTGADPSATGDIGLMMSLVAAHDGGFNAFDHWLATKHGLSTAGLPPIQITPAATAQATQVTSQTTQWAAVIEKFCAALKNPINDSIEYLLDDAVSHINQRGFSSSKIKDTMSDPTQWAIHDNEQATDEWMEHFEEEGYLDDNAPSVMRQITVTHKDNRVSNNCYGVILTDSTLTNLYGMFLSID
jgi:hypothetical protein